MSMKTLEEIRGQWEYGMKPLSVIDKDSCFLVILEVLEEKGLPEPLDPWKSRKNIYNCHRYFTIREDWVCSVDGERVEVEAVWSWLNDPAAYSTQKQNYIRPTPVQCEEEGADGT